MRGRSPREEKRAGGGQAADQHVCSALRAGCTLVRRPLIQPKTASAVSVTPTDHGSAPWAVADKK